MQGIHMNDVEFSYSDGFTAVDGVTLQINEGENVAIIGQNGAGKTTLVKMMNGLLRPQQGVVKVDEQDVDKLTVAQISRKVGYVFQNPGDQIFNRTVFDEIAFTPRYFKHSEAEVTNR